MELNELKEMKISELCKIANEYEINNCARMKKTDLIFNILNSDRKTGLYVF